MFQLNIIKDPPLEFPTSTSNTYTISAFIEIGIPIFKGALRSKYVLFINKVVMVKIILKKLDHTSGTNEVFIQKGYR